MFVRSRARAVTSTLTVLALALVMFTALAAAPQRADAVVVSRNHGYMLASGPKSGLGAVGEWMGSYSLGSRGPAYCIDYGKATPSTYVWRSTSSITGLSTQRFRRVGYVLNKYGSTRSNRQAAAVNAAVNLIVGNRNFASDWRTSYIPQLNRTDRAVVPLVRRFLREAATISGPYTTRVRFTKRALVGEHAHATVTVRSAAGRAMAGAPIEVRLRNAVPGRALPRVTGRTGSAAIDIVPIAPGEVAVRVIATNLPVSSKVGLNVPPSNAFQRLAGVITATTTSAGRAAFGSAFPSVERPAVDTNCPVDCDGAPPLTVRTTNPSTTSRLRITPVVDGVPLASKVLDLAPRATRSVTFIVRDGQKVSFTYSWGYRGVWTAPAPLGRTTTVLCPPKAHVAILVDCPCEGPVRATVTDLNTSRYLHQVVAAVVGGATRSTSVAANTTGTLAGVTWPRGGTLVVWVQNYLDGAKVGPLTKVLTVNVA
jgi:hypothetical protein